MKESRLRIIFFGTGNFGIPALQMLHEKHEILQVFTPSPKMAGRGKKLSKTPVHLFAESLKLPVINTISPKISDLGQSFDVGIVISYGALIPKSLLLEAKYGFLNLHPSDLPKFRGAAPIERTLENGETSTRVCIIKMTPRLDDGDIISSMKYSILPSDDAISLHEKFSFIGSTLLSKSVELLTTGFHIFEKQDHSLAIYAPKILKSELLLLPSWTGLTEGEKILNKIRAFTSYGCCYILYQDKRIKIKSAIFSLSPLTKLDLPCLEGYISPTIIKQEGKNFISSTPSFSL